VWVVTSSGLPESRTNSSTAKRQRSKLPNRSYEVINLTTRSDSTAAQPLAREAGRRSRWSAALHPIDRTSAPSFAAGGRAKRAGLFRYHDREAIGLSVTPIRARAWCRASAASPDSWSREENMRPPRYARLAKRRAVMQRRAGMKNRAQQVARYVGVFTRHAALDEGAQSESRSTRSGRPSSAPTSAPPRAKFSSTTSRRSSCPPNPSHRLRPMRASSLRISDWNIRISAMAVLGASAASTERSSSRSRTSRSIGRWPGPTGRSKRTPHAAREWITRTDKSESYHPKCRSPK